MSERDADDTRQLNEAFVSYIEQRLGALGIPTDSHGLLLFEDDWAFVVKIHALLEALVNDALATFDSRLDEFFRKLPLWQRLKAARAIDALPRETIDMIAAVSELRNGLVHEIRHASFTFDDERQELKGLVRKCVGAARAYVEDPKSKLPDHFRDFISKEPRALIWMITGHILSFLGPPASRRREGATGRADTPEGRKATT